jgi:integrase/recombinase XerC
MPPGRGGIRKQVFFFFFWRVFVKEGFISYIRVERRYSPHTVIAYSGDLDQFCAYLETQYGIRDPRDADHHIIRSWLVSLMESGMSARSVNRKLTALNSFYRYLKRQGSLAVNPMARVVAPKTSKRLPSFVEREKMEFLFDAAFFGEGFEGIRNRTILELFYATGMRVSELVALSADDIDLAEGTIKVLGKRNKERLIPLGNHMGSLLKTYMAERPAGSGFLFVTEQGAKLSSRKVYSVVKLVLSQVTTLEKRGPHTLRHTFATHMLNEGADLNSVKELLGHANLAATQVYTHNTIDKLKKIYEQAHPKA